MIIFERLKLRNFLSYGNNFTYWDFAPGQITRISGENGAGKSSCIVDATYFVLFGKTYRKQNMGQLVNWINKKELEVVLHFSIKETSFRVERGMAPNYLRIFKGPLGCSDDEMEIIEVSSANRNYQKMLEEDILHMNEDVFNQTVIKSLTKNISFMTLSKNQRRQIIESVLSIEVFTHMNSLIKVKLNEIKSKIDVYTEKKRSVNSEISAEEINIEYLKTVKNKMENLNKEKIITLNQEKKENVVKLKEFQTGQEKIEEYKIKEEELEQVRVELVKKKKGKNEFINNLRAKLAIAENKIDFFRETCPSCPKLKEIENDDSFAIEETKTNISLIENEVLSISHEIKDIDADLIKARKIISNEIFISSSIKSLLSRNDAIEKEIEDQKKSKDIIKIDNSKINKLYDKKTRIEDKYNLLSKHKRHYAVLRSLLADDGIKTFIIKKYLPHINKILNTYLQKFNTEILFKFDAEFNDIVYSRYKENSNYGCFSEGQKRRIDLSILFTFIEFSQIKNRNSNCNLLVLDEITTGLDQIGENILFDVIKGIALKENKEIVNVSHSANIDPEKVDRLFFVSLDKGFSKLELVEN